MTVKEFFRRLLIALAIIVFVGWALTDTVGGIIFLCLGVIWFIAVSRRVY